jgi:hypothetical protein
MFKKTSVNLQYDVFSTPPTQIGKPEAKNMMIPRHGTTDFMQT